VASSITAANSAPPPNRTRAARGTRRYKVVYLDHCAKASGAELALARMLPALRDFEPRVILAEQGALVSRLRERGIQVQVLPMARSTRELSRNSVRFGLAAVRAIWETSRYVARLVRLLEQERPDLVATNSLKSAVYGGLAATIAHVPVVWHLRDRVTTDYLPAPAVSLIRTSARLLPRAVIANSRATLQSLALGRGPKRALLQTAVPSPCDLAGAGRRASHRGDGGALVVGMVGRLQPWKGQDVFLRAFAAAFPYGGAVAVVVGGALFGEHDFQRSLEHLAADLGLRGRVRFTGHLDDPTSEMEGFDILVHASVIPEPFGQVIIEGMALGLPVVATGAGGPAEVISDRVDGLLYPPGDEAALAGALRELASDAGLRRRLGEAAARKAESYSPAAIAPQVEAVYKQALGKHA
jgi:glycosyltransferase involved in cell wall biosynthesis